MKLLNFLLNFLASGKLAILLLILITIASVIGTIMPKEFEHPIFLRLQLDDVYHSNWFNVLLFLFCINLCLCSLKNLPVLIQSLRLSKRSAERTDLSQLPYYSRIYIKDKFSNAPIIAKIIEKTIIRRHFYRLMFSSPQEKLFYFERGRISRFGYMITHISIIVILIGAITVGIAGYKHYIKIPEGGVSDVPNADFVVRADDFDVLFYPDTFVPKEYITVLSIIENGKTVFTGNIRVNHPLKYKGMKFLQSDYGYVDTLGFKIGKKVNEKIEPITEFKIDEGETIEIPETDLKVSLLTYMPDFFMDEKGNIGSRSGEARNPGAFLEVSDKKGNKERLWLFLRFPELKNIQKFDYHLEFVAIYPPSKYYTGLQVVSDKGISIIWVGCALIVFGLFISFYTSHKRLWVRIQPNNDEMFIEIGAVSYKDRSGFDKEFKSIQKAFEKY